MGGGDIKLMFFVGALLGPSKAIMTIFMGALIGTIVAAPSTLLRGGDRRTEIPFGPYLSLGAWISALYGEAIINGYLSATGLM